MQCQMRLGHAFLDQVGVHLGLVLHIAFGPALGDFVERRLGDVEIALLDQLRHLAIEEGQEQGADMGTIDISIGHDDDLVIAQLLVIDLVAADTGAERRDQRADLFRAEHPVKTGPLDIEDLAAQRQHGLVFPVASLLGRAAG